MHSSSKNNENDGKISLSHNFTNSRSVGRINKENTCSTGKRSTIEVRVENTGLEDSRKRKEWRDDINSSMNNYVVCGRTHASSELYTRVQFFHTVSHRDGAHNRLPSVRRRSRLPFQRGQSRTESGKAQSTVTRPLQVRLIQMHELRFTDVYTIALLCDVY